MAKKTSGDGRFERREKVVATVDLPLVPAGTRGKVQLVNGLSWIRYWVRFENGEQIGQLDKRALAREADWDFRNNRPRNAA